MSQNSNTDLSLDKALEEISQVFSPFPQNAVEELLTHKEVVQPFLLEKVINSLETLFDIPKGSMSHLYSIYILAHFKNNDLFPLIIKLMYLPLETIEHAFGEDFITGYDVPNIIASTFNGDLTSIYQICENKNLNDYTRASAIQGLMALVVTNQIKKSVVSDYLLSLVEKNILEDESPYLWAIVTSLVMDLYLHALIPFISEAFDNDYIDENYTDIEDFLEHFEFEAQRYNETMNDNYHCYHFIDAITDMSQWAGFNKEQKQFQENYELMNNLPVLLNESLKTNQNQSNTIKIGRNDPCHCSSGKKYKKCCLPTLN